MRLLMGTTHFYRLLSSNKRNFYFKNFDWKIKSCNYATLYAQTKLEKDTKKLLNINYEFSNLKKCNSYLDARLIHISRYLNNRGFNETYNTLIPSIILQQKDISSDEWEQVVTDIQNYSKNINNITIHSMIMKECRWAENYHLATSYVNFLKFKGEEMNLATHGYYLLICGLNVNICGEDRVLEVYQQLSGRVKIMDANLSEHAVIALSYTSSWQQLFKHLPVIRHMCSISVNLYSYIISAAMRNGQHTQAWEYFDEMFQKPNIHELENVPQHIEKVIQSWLSECSIGEDLQDKQLKLRTLLTKMQMYHITPSASSSTAIKEFCQSHLDWYAKEAVIYKSGRCNSCGNKLAQVKIPDEEFEKLKVKFTEDVLKGSDIFRATSPEEWEDFKDFVQTNAPFTHVVDALNVSLKVGGKDRQILLEKVLSNLTNQAEAKVLVIGRKHISKMISRVKLTIRRGAVFYNLDNASKDDGFFIYAALQSGQETKIVTSDLLRDHLARLKDPSMKRTFRFWQKSHQVYIPLGYNTQLIHPPQYNTLTHECKENIGTKSKDKKIDFTQDWHIPIENGEDAVNFLVPPKTWLCLQKSLMFSNVQHENDYIKDNEQRIDIGISDDQYKIQNNPRPKRRNNSNEQIINFEISDERYQIQNKPRPKHRNQNRISDYRHEFKNKPWPKYNELNSINEKGIFDGQLENREKMNSEVKYSVPEKKFNQLNPSKQKVIDDDYHDFDYTKSKKPRKKDLSGGKTRKWTDRSKISMKVDNIFKE